MLPLNTEIKHKEWNTILHVVKTNGFLYTITSKLHTPITQELTLPPSHNKYNFQSKMLVTFTYWHSKIRISTYLFNSTNIHITFGTYNTICDINKTCTNNTNTYMHSGI